MDRRLVDVSQAGNMEAFYLLLEDEPQILEFIDKVPFTRTPLHIAILAKKWDFAKEISRFKPSFITKPDSFGFSPLHLTAKRTGEVGIGNNKNDAEDMVGRIELVKLMLNLCPECVLNVTTRNETVLHLAMKNKLVGVFVALVEWLKEVQKKREDEWLMSLNKPGVHSSSCDDESNIGVINELLNWKDDGGNTILHLATMMKHQQMIEALLSSNNNQKTGFQLEINALNGNNFTPLDILSQLPKDKQVSQIEHKLVKKGAKTTTNQVISLCPSIALNIQNYPTLSTQNPSSNTIITSLGGLDKIAMSASVILLTCLLTATNAVKYQPYLVYMNMVGFLMSFAILAVVSMTSRGRNILMTLMVIALGSYLYLVFSAISSKDWVFFGTVFLNIGAAISVVILKLLERGFHITSVASNEELMV